MPCRDGAADGRHHRSPERRQEHAVQPHRRQQQAIVEDRPGVTRDRKELEAEWLGIPFLVVDTGGWMPGGDELDAKVSRQVEAAVQEADVVLFVVDASVGLTDDDQTIANWLRRVAAPTSSSSPTRPTTSAARHEMWEFMSLGLGEPVPGQRAARPARRRPARRGDRPVPRRAPAPINEQPDPWDADRRRRRRGRRRAGAAARGDRRAPQRRQEHAVQPAGRRGPLGRPRPGRHHPRLHRHARRDRGRADRVRRHRRHAPQGARSTTRPSTTRSSGRCGRSTMPTSPCS